MKNLDIIVSHPIQYYAPLFALIAKSKQINLQVFYTWGQAKEAVYDPGFGKNRSWDIPLLEGYNYTFLHNTAKEPGSHHFRGINNPSIIKEIDAFKPEIILVIGWAFKSHLKVLRHYKSKVPIWFRGDSTLLDEQPNFSLKKLLRRVWLTWVYSHIDKALYVGHNNKAYYLQHGVKEQQLVFAPHAIDNKRFQQVDTIINFRQQLGITESAFVFLFVGKFETKKNPIILLKAFLQLQIPEINLVFVGNGNLEKELQNFAKGLTTKVYFLPFQNQSAMPSVYRMANAMVLPSQGPGETWGLAVNEALASGTPCIVSNKCGCAADLICNGKNGYVFDSNNEAALIIAMKNMVAKKEIIKAQMQKNNIINQYSFQSIIATIEQQANTL